MPCTAIKIQLEKQEMIWSITTTLQNLPTCQLAFCLILPGFWMRNIPMRNNLMFSQSKLMKLVSLPMQFYTMTYLYLPGQNARSSSSKTLFSLDSEPMKILFWPTSASVISSSFVSHLWSHLLLLLNWMKICKRYLEEAILSLSASS